MSLKVFEFRAGACGVTAICMWARHVVTNAKTCICCTFIYSLFQTVDIPGRLASNILSFQMHST